MKKNYLLFLLLFLFACESNKVVNNNIVKEPKKVLANIELAETGEELPDYLELKNEDMYKDLLIIYSEEGRGGHIASRTVYSYVLKNYGFKSVIKKDSEVTKDDLVTNNIFLIGNSKDNRVIKALYEKLPIKYVGDKVSLWGKELGDKELGISYFYPNLYNKNKVMFLMMGNSNESLKLYDFNSYDIVLSYKTDTITTTNFKEFAFANFDNKWDQKELRIVDKSELASGEGDVLPLGEIKKYTFPEWAKGKVIYQIFLRSFADSDGNGKGDLKGLEATLDYLNYLGVDIIWLNPIFESPSYHGYDMKDYFKIDEDYGTIEDFKNLVKAADEKGIKIILDIAFNHSSKMEEHFRDAYGNPKSKYDKWFYFTNIQNTMYHDWYFRDNPGSRDSVNSNMPAWNTNNPEVVDFHMEILKYWLDMGVAGFRMDVAKGPDHRYWKAIRQKLKSYNKDALLVGEVWVDLNDYAPYFQDEFDAIFDFTLQGSMTSGVFGDIKSTLSREEDMGIAKNMARFMSNHDMDRFPTYVAKERLKLYGTLVFTLNGMPTLYYGDELGLKGDGADGDEGRRRPFEWTKDNKDKFTATWHDVYSNDVDGISVEEQKGVSGSLLEEYRKLIKIRRDYNHIFAEGKVSLVEVYKDAGKNASRTLTYFVKSGDKRGLVILNFDKEGAYSFRFGSEGKFKEVLNGGSLEMKKDMNLELERNKAYIYIEE